MERINDLTDNLNLRKNVIRIESYVFSVQFDRFLNSKKNEVLSKLEKSKVYLHLLSRRFLAKFLSIVEVFLIVRLSILAVLDGRFIQESRPSIARIFASSWHGVPEEIETKAGRTQNSPIDGLASRINKKLVQKSIFLHQNLVDRNFSIKDRVLTNLFQLPVKKVTSYQSANIN